jgi:hypothetical protein
MCRRLRSPTVLHVKTLIHTAPIRPSFNRYSKLRLSTNPHTSVTVTERLVKWIWMPGLTSLPYLPNQSAQDIQPFSL